MAEGSHPEDVSNGPRPVREPFDRACVPEIIPFQEEIP